MTDEDFEQLRAENEQLREMQHLLENSASRYADLYDYAPIGLCTLDLAGHVRDINLTGATLVRRSRADIAGCPIALLLDIDASAVRAHLLRCHTSGRRTVTEFPLLSGPERALQLTSVGVGRYFATEFSDVSERKRAYLVLRLLGDLSHALMRLLEPAEIVQVAARTVLPVAEVVAIDLLGADNRWRSAALENAEPALRARLAEVTPGFGLLPRIHQAALAAHADGAPQIIADLRDELEDPAITAGRAELVTTLGLSGCIVVPLVTTGATVGMLTVIMGQSGRVLGPSDVALFGEIGRRISAALERAQLHAKVVDASRAKDHFLAMVSHELRTPLAALLMWTRTLRDGGDPSARTRAIDAIERAARLQSRLVGDLVDLARSLGGKLSLSLGPVEFERAVVDAIDTQRGLAGQRGVDIEIERRQPCGEVWADPLRLAQIVANLVSNAVKFSADGGRVLVTLDSDGEDVSLVVRDDGIGIAPELLPQLFEPFRQLDEAVDHKSAGLGLGLAIVKQLVELHGGSVDAESEGRGLGARFTVRLPMLRAAEQVGRRPG